MWPRMAKGGKEMKKILTIAAIMLLALVAVIPASAVWHNGVWLTEEEQQRVIGDQKVVSDVVTGVDSKYQTVPKADANDPWQYCGQLQIHADYSYLVSAGYDRPVYLTNDAFLKYGEYRMMLNPDGTKDEFFIPGNFHLKYGKCDVPVIIRKGEVTLIPLGVCDR